MFHFHVISGCYSEMVLKCCMTGKHVWFFCHLWFQANRFGSDLFAGHCVDTALYTFLLQSIVLTLADIRNQKITLDNRCVYLYWVYGIISTDILVNSISGKLIVITV